MLTSRISLEKGTNLEALYFTTNELNRSGYSYVLKTELQAMQRRLRQTFFSLADDLELVTLVGDPQYIHTMSIYCHKAMKYSSG